MNYRRQFTERVKALYLKDGGTEPAIRSACSQAAGEFPYMRHDADRCFDDHARMEMFRSEWENRVDESKYFEAFDVVYPLILTRYEDRLYREIEAGFVSPEDVGRTDSYMLCLMAVEDIAADIPYGTITHAGVAEILNPVAPVTADEAA